VKQSSTILIFGVSIGILGSVEDRHGAKNAPRDDIKMACFYPSKIAIKKSFTISGKG
jgi:hypothetical protein